MKRTFLIPFLIAFGLTFGCDSELPVSADELKSITEAEGQIAEKKGFGASSSASPVYTFAGMEEVGSSELVRTDNQLAVKIQTTGLEHHQVITLWWVIFNNPEACSNGECGEADLFDGPDGPTGVEPSCVYADGGIAGGNGHSRFQDRLNMGDQRNSCIDFFVDLIPELEGEDHGLLNPGGPKYISSYEATVR